MAVVPELPASVRVAVWISYAWSRGADPATVLRAALPDVDVVVGLEERLDLWRSLGEQGLYAALSRPGASGILPRCSGPALAAATDAGEAVFVAGVGGLAVPLQVPFGTASGGLAIRWEGFDAEPMPVHRLAGVDVAGADQELRVAIHTTTEALGDGGWVDAWARPPSLGRAGREWSLPTEMPGRVLGLITRAAGVLRIAESGLEHADGSTSALLAEQRRAALLSLRDSATHALEAATCAAAGYFAAQSRSTRS